MIKLLVVDDSALVRKLLGGIFASEPDFSVSFARNGREALELLPKVEPDVVTLDVHMPEMDGLTCLDRIMAERPCPVVMVSSLTALGADATLRALDLGAVDFVPKPSGAISLEIDRIAPVIVQKVRLAAETPIRKSLRLAERVRARVRAFESRAPEPRIAAGRSPAASRPIRPRLERGAVLVGCSTGGPPALDTLLSQLPADFPLPVVVAQHMPSSFTAALARRLDGLCALSVVEVTRPMPLEPGHVFIARGDADTLLSSRAGEPFVLTAPASPAYLWHPSVDRMVASALEFMDPAGLVGVLMTGMGRDGAEAMTRLHQGGGRTIAEAEETAVVWGMPGELVKAGGADFVEPVHLIPQRLLALVG
ncbi:protein-glutamate methylesterase/protein-glutamine glutaminase [Enterovirga sp. CN4-39]|uniref:protein-glutamate methylesterase/protein-glutamine glutaminase n=1 Tax=Enterovirga sp. CN4-39 TaxID=3400910 RepID=UPI003C10DC1F